MAKANPIKAIESQAKKFADVTAGESCNQKSFKVGKVAFLYLGPGAKGVGFKAMFKLKASMLEAKQLVKDSPKEFEIGNTGWVTSRFTDEKPLPKALWQKWLKESYDVATGQ